jgi:NAD(P)-dependent dehydrogenase (short-subunit alcohol dehydrogenase family)
MEHARDTPLSMDTLPQGYRAIVVGASGGLGRAFCQALQADPRCATVRGLGRNTVPELDLQNPVSVQAAAQNLNDAQPWHLLIVASGILHSAGLRPEKRLADVEATSFERVLAINTIGPALVLRHFAPLMDKSRSLMGLLSAKVGSIGDNRLGGWYAYRASKAALNMVVKTAAIELARTHKGLVLAALHPGTVRTGLSEPFNGQALGRAPGVAAGQLLTVLNDLRPEDSGCFKAYDGEPLAW